MRVLVIGYGSMGKRHAANALALGHEVMVYDTVWPPPTCADHGLAWAAHYEHALSWRPQAVIVSTPAATHAQVVRQLATNHYDGPLFVEKPIALSTADSEVFRGWPHQSTQVGYNWRFHEPLRQWTCGPFHWLHFECDTNIATWPGSAYGPPLLECSHEIDYALSLGARFGMAGGLDHVANGAWVQLYAPSVLVDVRWHATRIKRQLTMQSYRIGLTETLDLTDADALEQSYRDELKHFLLCADKQMPTRCSFADGIRTLAVCEQAQAQIAEVA